RDAARGGAGAGKGRAPASRNGGRAGRGAGSPGPSAILPCRLRALAYTDRRPSGPAPARRGPPGQRTPRAGRSGPGGYNPRPARTPDAMSASQPKVGFVSLGCPKALVDSERILTQLRVEGYQIVPSYDAADVVVVNTCGFIDSAVEESLDAIGEALAENGKVIVTGCLGKRPE